MSDNVIGINDPVGKVLSLKVANETWFVQVQDVTDKSCADCVFGDANSIQRNQMPVVRKDIVLPKEGEYCKSVACCSYERSDAMPVVFVRV